MKSILFLCSGNYYRSRFAEEYFNHMAAEAGIAWRADSKGLYQDLSFLENIGTVSIFTLQELARRGVICKNQDRWPVSVGYDDFSKYNHVVAMDKDEHYPMVLSLFPRSDVAIEYWDIKDIGFEDPISACYRITANINGLIEKLAFTDPRMSRKAS